MEKIKNNRIYKRLMKNNEFTNIFQSFINSDKKVITADASWYIDIYDKLDWDQHPHVYDKNFNTEKWVKENAKLLANVLNMTEKEVISPSVIEKIDNGFTVADCYSMYSDYYKEAHGFRPRGDYLDESSKDAFLEDYHKRMDNLEEIVKEEDVRWQKAVEENDKKIDDVINTAKEPEGIAEFKDENRFELSDEALNKLRKGINDKVHEKLMDNIDFYTIDELNQFKDGYYNHITKEDMKLIDNKIKELEKEEEYENMKIGVKKHAGSEKPQNFNEIYSSLKEINEIIKKVEDLMENDGFYHNKEHDCWHKLHDARVGILQICEDLYNLGGVDW